MFNHKQLEQLIEHLTIQTHNLQIMLDLLEKDDWHTEFRQVSENYLYEVNRKLIGTKQSLIPKDTN